jgi:hypothetical protein
VFLFLGQLLVSIGKNRRGGCIQLVLPPDGNRDHRDFGMQHAYRFATQRVVADDVNGGLSRIELFHARCKILTQCGDYLVEHLSVALTPQPGRFENDRSVPKRVLS